MRLSKSGDTFLLKCHCGCYNLSFNDHGVELCGQVNCLICGAAAEWSELLQGCSDTSAPTSEGEFSPATAPWLPSS